jgi:hypothetical protein
MADRVLGMVAAVALTVVSVMWLVNFASLGH